MRVQHVVAGHALVAGVDVGADVAERVADVQTRAATGTGTCRGRRAWAGRRPARSRSASGPVGFGASNVPSASQRSCQRRLDLLGERGRVAVRGAGRQRRAVGVDVGHASTVLATGRAHGPPHTCFRTVRPMCTDPSRTRCGASPPPDAPDAEPIADAQRRLPGRPAAARSPSSTAPRPRSRVPWAELHDEATASAATLQAQGVGPGDHVAILGPTSRALVTAIQAVLAGRRHRHGAAAADAHGLDRGVRRRRPGRRIAPRRRRRSC